MLTGDPADPIDRLMFVTGGEVLRVDPARENGGEMDSYRGGRVSMATMRRLQGARLVSSVGMPADVLQHACSERSAEVGRMNPDELVTWYVGQCVAGLDYRARAREHGAAWHEQTEPDPDPVPTGEVPQWASDWLTRTLHAPKADYLGALVCWAWLGDAEPTTPATAWGPKTRAKFDARRKRGQVTS
jgi:hypothetical protein